MIERRITHQGLRSFRIVRAATEAELEAKIQAQLDRWAARFNCLEAANTIQQKRQSRNSFPDDGDRIAIKLKSELEEDLTLIHNLLKIVVEAGSAAIVSEKLISWTQQADEVRSKVSRRKRIQALDAEVFGDADEIFDGAEDPMYQDAVRVILEMGKASTSTLSYRLRLGYGRAARILDMMQREGIIGPPDGSKPREVLKKPDWLLKIESQLR